MRILSLLFLTFFLGKGCDAQEKKDVETAAIEYTANTRGYYQKIVVQNQKYSVSKIRDTNVPADLAISNSDWKKIIDAFQEVDLEGFPNLKAPTQKRLYDGAPIADLRITYKGKEYFTPSFDHGNPPDEIKKLVDRITLLALPKE